MKGLILSFDTEDYGRKAISDIESSEHRDFCVNSVSNIIDVLNYYEKGATFFILGKLIEVEDRIVKLFNNVKSNLKIDVEQHLYSHSKIYEDGREPKRNVLSISEIDYELKLTNKLIHDNFGFKCQGVRVPYCFEEGIVNRLDIQKIFLDNGFKFVSTQLGGVRNRIFRISENTLQPYYLANGLLEIPINGLMDVAFLDHHNKKINMDLKKVIDLYIDDLVYCVKNDYVYSPVFHPWCVSRIDPELKIIKKLIEFCIDNKVKVFDCKSFAKIY